MSARECPSILELDDYLQGRLKGPLSDQVANHIAACTVCRALIDTVDHSANVESAIDAKASQARGDSIEAALLAVRRFGRPGPADSSQIDPHGDTVPYHRSPDGTGVDFSISHDGKDAEHRSPPPLPDRYVPVREIARGGMGAVWEVRDAEFDRPLAVKVMLPHVASDKSAVARFQREADITARLQHPAIPPVVDRGVLADGAPYFSLKLIQGKTLDELLDERSDLTHDLPRFLGVFEQICQAVGYAHSQGIIHRDLKPANVMVGAFGEVQVMDWGMAKAIGDGDFTGDAPTEGFDQSAEETDDQLTRAGQVMGTLRYMPPEQAQADATAIDARSDVFALGGILCRILTGEPPYPADQFQRLYQAVRTADLAAAHDRLAVATVDDELKSLCRWSLSATAAERPENGAAVAQAVADYQQSVRERLERERAERAAAEVRATEERKRRRVMMALAMVVVLLIAGGSGGAWWYQRERLATETAAAIESRIAEKDIRSLLDRAAELRNRYDFKTARTLLSQADSRVGRLLDPDEFTSQLANSRRSLDMVEGLDAIRLRKSTIDSKGNVNVNYGSGRDGAYSKAFRDYGIDVLGTPTNAAAAEIARSPVKRELIAALDDWAKNDAGVREQLLAVARAADPHPIRSRLRDPTRWQDRAWLRDVMRQIELDAVTPALLDSLASRLHSTSEFQKMTTLLKLSAMRHPRDFWRHLMLASNSRGEEAIGYLRAAISIRPDIAVAHHNMGFMLSDQKRIAEAESSYRKAIELDPRNDVFRANLGDLFVQTKRLKAAEAEYRKAVALNPRVAQNHNSLATVLRDLGRLEESEQSLRTCIRLEPNSAVYHANLGGVLAKSKQHREAEKELRRAVELNPRGADSHNNLGYVLIVTKQYREAESVCKTAIELSPRSVDARVNFASLLAATRRPEQAEAEFRNAITIDQEHAIAHNGLGLLLKSMNRFEEAEVEFRKAIAINPNYMTAYFNFGQLLREGGRLEEAERAFRNAILANRKDARAYCELGLVLAQQMKRDRAAAMYRKAIFLDPDLSAAYCNLGVLLVQSTDRFSEAIELFEHARQSQNPVWSARATRFKALAKQLQVMDETLAAVRAGKILPRNSVQVVALADFALTQKRQPWIAAKLFLTGFGDSALTPRIRSRYRYNAARAVLLVAAGRVEMGAKMPIPEEAARQRALGLSFLRTDLELWNKVMAGNDRARRAAVRRLQHWRVDPDLEIVRDASINKLSPHEQVAWRQFWSDVLEVVQSQPVAALRP